LCYGAVSKAIFKEERPFGSIYISRPHGSLVTTSAVGSDVVGRVNFTPLDLGEGHGGVGLVLADDGRGSLTLLARTCECH
jgi:hypothetical protein